ncbi:nucleotidyl transferase AbiEii/AbiGii toxin family protein [Burkholderia guangdongensis]|uniref:nucleotidyl transferase AbiEii/AbiGii toxin family protein n=1 Tax=Burkholderia guangdongensis TaxID=1792500 RepID=UPI0015CEED8C|nr:nucleotidyl transferase AbiEii/AbiGii toxin family protein [Burkholderia guangdongensis]
MNERNVAASVRARLLNRARETQQDFSLVLTRYAIERLLYRISISNHADQFLLKGALLFDLWFDIPHRPTRDADFLGFGSTELPHIEGIFKEICAIEVLDGVAFQPDTVRAAEIRKEANYAGVRVMLLGMIDGARCQIQIDIGFGDAITPGPEDVEYPVMLPEFAAPKLRVYPRYTVVAEKFEALSSLGIANSRMKDYFDLWILARHTDFDGDILRQAVQGTFDRRKTALTQQAPFGLTDAFAQDAQKQTQWLAFLKKNRLQELMLEEVIVAVRAFMLPVLHAASADAALPLYWSAGGPWSPAKDALRPRVPLPTAAENSCGTFGGTSSGNY